MAVKPTFKLYRIIDKTTGKAFQGFGSARRPLWTLLGCFYRRIDTIKRHIETMQYEWTVVVKVDTRGIQYLAYQQLAEIPHMKDKLIVEIYNVAELEKKTIEATDLLKDTPKIWVHGSISETKGNWQAGEYQTREYSI